MYTLLKVILADETFYLMVNQDWSYELKEEILYLLESDSTLTKEQILDGIELHEYDASVIDVRSVIDGVKGITYWKGCIEK